MTLNPRIRERIESRQAGHIERVKELIRRPSISAENRGMIECAELLRGYFRELGCERSEVVATKKQPVVYAEYEANKPVTLIVYFMYDVKQVEGEDWKLIKDPFDPQLVEMPPFKRCLVGRGAVNQKGPLGAFLNAMEEMIAVNRELPVNLKFICDGEEEIGSPHLLDFAVEYLDRLKDADGVIFPSAAQNTQGVPHLSLGCKGSAPFELECSGTFWGRGPTTRGIHSSYAALVDSPAWRLIHALSTMTDPAHPDRVKIDGFYDNVLPPSEEDLQIVEKLIPRYDEESVKQNLGVDCFIDDVHGRDAILKLLYSPTLNIQGIYGGHIGVDFKTVTPHSVSVKLESRLVPEQTYKEILTKVRQHLDKRGFRDIKIVKVRGSDTAEGARSHEWAKTSPNSWLVQATTRTYDKMGYDPTVWPHGAGSAPWHVFTKRPLKLPMVQFGLNHGGRAHAPDEYLVIEGNDSVKGLAEFELSFVQLLEECSHMSD